IGLPGRLDEAEVDHLAVAGRRQPLAQRVLGAPALGRRHHGRGRARRVRGDALEAVDARHLLDEVFLDLEVEAKAGWGDDEAVFLALERKTELLEYRAHFVFRERN